MRKLSTFVLAFALTLGVPTAVFAHHYGYKYSAPSLSSLSVVSCTEVRVTWKRTGPFTGVNYARNSNFYSALNWDPWEYGTRDQVRGATTAVVKNLRPGVRHYFRVSADEYGGHRLSRYSIVRSILLPAC